MLSYIDYILDSGNDIVRKETVILFVNKLKEYWNDVLERYAVAQVLQEEYKLNKCDKHICAVWTKVKEFDVSKPLIKLEFKKLVKMLRKMKPEIASNLWKIWDEKHTK